MPETNKTIEKTPGQVAAEQRIAARKATASGAAQPLDDFCMTYRVPMVRIRQHVGEGNEGWSEPLCPRIHQLNGEGCVCKGEVPDAKMTSQEREAVAQQPRPDKVE